MGGGGREGEGLEGASVCRKRRRKGCEEEEEVGGGGGQNEMKAHPQLCESGQGAPSRGV